MRVPKIIALLLPESKQDFAHGDELAHATALLRDEDGRMSLQPFTHDMPFTEQAITTGCFRRGKPIIDPTTREVIGYEMEMISGLEAHIAGARLQLSH
jgi:hypothetical protein